MFSVLLFGGNVPRIVTPKLTVIGHLYLRICNQLKSQAHATELLLEKYTEYTQEENHIINLSDNGLVVIIIDKILLDLIIYKN